MYNIVQKMDNNLFGKGKEKILACFYRNRNKEMYFSEILRQTGLTQNTTLKHLQKLQENKLIFSTKKIGHTFYRINEKNPIIYSIFSYFDNKKFLELPFERRSAIIEFLDNASVKPLMCVVFGSTAKGTYTHESDIDILLVYNKDESVDKKLIKDIEAVTGTNIQPFVIDIDYFTEQLLKKEDKVFMHAIKTGFVVRGSAYYYREVLHG